MLPLILDSILHRKLPWLFNPNAITLMQNEKLSFTQVQYRKRKDRFLQIILFISIGLLFHNFLILGSRLGWFLITTFVTLRHRLITSFWKIITFPKSLF